MRKLDLEDMDFDELWLMHEELTQILAEKISAEKLKLEKRLAQLNRKEQIREAPTFLDQQKSDRPRRKYPKVLPKYSNPSAPLETWSGRGKQPLWFVAALRSGHRPEDLRIRPSQKLAVAGTGEASPSKVGQSPKRRQGT
jgi:DNA-binding protein H-NS